MNTTRRYPRTLEEAFGPYAGRSIHERPTPMSLADRVIVGLGLITAAGLLVAVAAGWL